MNYKDIKVTVNGTMTDEIQRAYSRQLAKLLLKQYGEDFCKVLIIEMEKTW